MFTVSLSVTSASPLYAHTGQPTAFHVDAIFSDVGGGCETSVDHYIIFQQELSDAFLILELSPTLALSRVSLKNAHNREFFDR